MITQQGKELKMSGKTEVEAGMPTVIEYINERAMNLTVYSDKLSKAISVIDDYIGLIGPKAGIKFTDPEVFFDEFDECIGPVTYKLSIRKEWGLYAIPDCMEIEPVLITESIRPMKKAMVKRLPEFLSLYAAELEKFEKEYKDISEKATRMAAILEEVA